MGSEIEKNAIQKAKDFLEITEELDAIALYDRLRDYRYSLHPDRVIDENVKKAAEEKFKQASAILTNLSIAIEREQVEKPASEIVPYTHKYEIVRFKRHADIAQERIAELEKEVERYTSLYDFYFAQNKKLEQSLEKKQSDESQEERNHLKALYATPVKGVAAIGGVVILLGCLGVITQMENVASHLQKFSPFPETYISGGLFVAMLYLLILAAKRWVESAYISQRAEEVCSPKYASDFITYLDEHPDREGLVETNVFTEVEAFNFIAGENKWHKRILGVLGFTIYRQETTTKLSGIFLNNLLNKKLIDISNAVNLQRVFKIKEK